MWANETSFCGKNEGIFYSISVFEYNYGAYLRQTTSKRHASQSKGPGPSRLTRHPHTCVTHMADVLGDFGPKKCGGSGSSSSHTQRRRRSRRRKAKWQYGADRVHVEIKCCRHSVEAKWQFGADKLKADLLAATVFTRACLERSSEKVYEPGPRVRPT